MTLIADRRCETSRSTTRGQGSRLAGLVVGLSLAALALAGCQVSEFATGAPQYAPIPAALERKIERLGMSEDSPILVRIYKQESTLEVWKVDKSGRYKLLTEYEVCAWSGEIGPKVKEGDRQAPEGFYNVSPGLMNPRSSYHLAFNIGFPNAYDRSLGRTGSNIMVHGDCSSRGCFAMEDKNIEEIYALAREAFEGGQRAFQVQIFPFRMTAENLAKHADSPHIAFWEMLKEGSDHFELTGQAPKIDICRGQYVFNAKPVVGSFQASAACPAYEVDPAIEQLVAAKRDADNAKRETLVASLQRQKEREARRQEREQAVAAFFNTNRDGAADLGAPETAAAAASGAIATETATPIPAATMEGGVPVPRPSPRAVATAEPSSGGFRLFGRGESKPEPVVASTAAVVPAASTEPATAGEAPASPAPAATVAAAEEGNAEALTGTEALGFQPTETEDGFLSSVAKGSRGLFRKATDIFN